MKRLLGVLTMFAIAKSALAAGQPAIVLAAKGVQIYECARSGDGYAWTFTGPEAMLTDLDGHPAGRHFAGPSWQANDGSVVMGEVLVASPGPGGGAIPWIVLRAKQHDGDGQFAAVAYIVRSATKDGLAPATGCDAGQAGAERRVNYEATYTFFPSPPR